MMVSAYYIHSNIAEIFCCIGLLYTIANSLFPERNYFYHHIISSILSGVTLSLMVLDSSESLVVFVFIAIFSAALLIQTAWLYYGVVYMNYYVLTQNPPYEKSHRDATMLLAYGTFGIIYIVGKSDFHCPVLSSVIVLFSFSYFSPLLLPSIFSSISFIPLNQQWCVTSQRLSSSTTTVSW